MQRWSFHRSGMDYSVTWRQSYRFQAQELAHASISPLRTTKSRVLASDWACQIGFALISNDGARQVSLTRPWPTDRLYHAMKHHSPLGYRSISVPRRRITVKAVIRAATILRAFASTSEILQLRTVAARSHFNKATAFRLSETLVEAGLLDRIGHQGYRLCTDMVPSRHYRIGCGAQSSVVPFTATVTEGLRAAAGAANVDLFALNNNFSAKTALQNADRLVQILAV
jgi:hypothetical protein